MAKVIVRLPPALVASSIKIAPICEIILAAGEGIEPSVSAFKAQRVAGYTIPQKAGMRDEGKRMKMLSL